MDNWGERGVDTFNWNFKEPEAQIAVDTTKPEMLNREISCRMGVREGGDGGDWE